MTDISYILTHLAEFDPEQSRAVAPPIYQTSNFFYKNFGEFRQAIEDEKKNLIYTRGNNPTVNILEKKMAALEHTEDALIFSSGVAAISSAIISNIKSGDHVICVKSPYSWTNYLLNTFLKRFNVEVTMVDGTDVNNFERAIQPNTTIIYLESPNTFLFELQDIEAVANIARKNNIVTIIDNSYNSPINQQPADLGVDIVVHSASKYIGGHSDLVAGVVCSTKVICEKIFYNEYLTLGGIISPFNAWLMLRGLRTLNLRIERSAISALEVAKYLDQHPKIQRVSYPFLETYPQHQLAKKQMKRGSGLMSIFLNTKDVSQIEKFVNAFKVFKLAVSWGGHESLLFPAAITGNNDKLDMPINLVRLYVGLEEPELLINDLENALKCL